MEKISIATGALTPTAGVPLTPIDNRFSRNELWIPTPTSIRDVELISPRNSWEIARKLFLKKVEEEEGSLKKVDEGLLRDTASPKDAIEVCQKVKDRADSEYTKGYVQVGSTKLFLKEKLTRILRKIQTFAVFGDATMNFNPESTALIWAAVRIILQVVLEDLELCGFLVDSCDEISSAMFIGEVHEKRYARLCERNQQTPAIDSDADMSIGLKIASKIPYLYSEVLYFSYQAKRSMGHKKLVRAMRNVFKAPLLKLKGCLETIVKIKGEISQIAGMEYQEASMELLESLYNEAKKNAEALQIGMDDMRTTSAFIKEMLFTTSRDIQDIKDLLNKNLDKEEQKRLQEECKANINWIGPLDNPRSEMMKSLDAREKGTCKWILHKRAYKTWVSEPDSRFLWVSGDVGSGKTTLMSYITEKLQKKLKKAASGADSSKKKKKKSKKDATKVENATKQDSTPAGPILPKLLVFFCKTGNDQTQTTESVLWNLIAQVYDYCESRLVKSPELLAQCNERISSLQKNEKETGVSLLQAKSARGKHKPAELQRLLLSFGNIVKEEFYVVIDALDECTDRVSENLIPLLKTLAETDKHFKIIVSGRPEPDIQEELGNVAQISVGVKQNNDDIKAFVNTELKKISNLTDAERAEAPKEIAKRAAGMFRYAALAVESLKQPWQRPIRAHLKSFPGVEDLYQRNIEQLTPQHRVLLLTAIRWTLLADRPVAVTQVAEDYNGIFKAVDFGKADEDKKGSDIVVQTTAVDSDSDDHETPADKDDGNTDDNSEDDSDSDDDSEDEGSDEEAEEEAGDAEAEEKERGEVVTPVDTEEQPATAESGEVKAEYEDGTKTDGAKAEADVGEENAQEDQDKKDEEQAANDEEEEEERKHQELLADDVRHIKTANSVFLRVLDSNAMEFRHASAKEFILDSAEKGLKLRSETLCGACLDRMHQVSAIDCAPKMGHLKLAITCLQHLNNETFQKRYLLSRYPEPQKTNKEENQEATDETKADDTNEEAQGDGDVKADGESKESSDGADKGQNNETKVEPMEDTVTLPLSLNTEHPEEPLISITSPSIASISESTEAAYDEARNRDVDIIDDTDHGKLNTESGASATKNEPEHNDHDGNHLEVNTAVDPHKDEVESVDTDYGSLHEWNTEQHQETTEAPKVLRYEIEKWHIHLREADRLWTEAEKEKEEDWKLLWRLVDKFMIESRDAFKAWQRAMLWAEWNLTDPLNPLCVASALNIPSLVDRMIAKGPFTDPEWEDELTPIFFAAYLDNPGIARKVLAAGINADTVIESNDAKDRPMDWAMWWPTGDRSEIVQILLDAGAKANFPEREGLQASPLHFAANRNMVAGCKALIEKGANVNAKDKLGETPLHWALTNMSCLPEIIQVLLDAGAKVNEEDNESQMPLYEAAMSTNAVSVKIMVDAGAEINDPDIFGTTALHISSQNGYLDIVKVLVDAGADLFLRDNKGKTPLARAVDWGRIEVVQYLIPKYVEKDPTFEFLLITDNRGRTICHKAAAKGYSNIVEEILRFGDPKKTLAARDYKYEATPLHPAAWRNRTDCVKVLVEAGADLTAKNANGHTPVELAWRGWAWSEGRDWDTMLYLAKMCPNETETIKSILLLGAGNNETILQGVLDVAGVDAYINIKDEHGWTPMMRACQLDEHGELEKILLKYGAEAIDLKEEAKTFPNNEKLGMRPSAMCENRKGSIIHLSEGGLVVSMVTESDAYQAYSVLANHPFPAGKLVHYWEVEILPGGDEACIVGIGFGSEYNRLDDAMPGWKTLKTMAYGYHSDDGMLYSSLDDFSDSDNRNHDYGPTWTQPGDVVGCIVDLVRQKVVYTKNGVMLGVAFRNVDGRRYFPMLGLYSRNSVRVNFGLDGERPFVFKVDEGALEALYKEDEGRTGSLEALANGEPATVLPETKVEIEGEGKGEGESKEEEKDEEQEQYEQYV